MIKSGLIILYWDDEEFIIHNIEFRIGQNLQNKDLWKLYIEFWRLKNPKIMVGVYSRYCSFFLDDFEMRKEFEKEAEKLEIFVDDRILGYKEFQSRPIPRRRTKKECLIPKPNFDKYFRQNFPFHNSFINYLMDKTKAEVLQKLFLSCKYFFMKKPNPICHRLISSKNSCDYHDHYLFNRQKNSDQMFFDQQSLSIAKDHPCLNGFKNLILSNSVYIVLSFPDFTYKTILSKVYRSEIKFLSIRYRSFPIKDYLFLTESKTILELHLAGTTVVNTDGSLANLEDLMINLPNAYKIIIGSITELNPESFVKISEMPRNSKLKNFEVFGCKEISFNVDGFLKFLKENMRHDLHFAIHINKTADDETFETNSCNKITAFLENFPEYNKKCSSISGGNFITLIIK